MSLAVLRKDSRAEAKRIMGVDCSTYSFAFCIFENRRPVQWGIIFFEGKTIYDRIKDAANKIREVQEHLKVDYVCMEAAIMVKSQDTAIKMAYVYGAVLAELLRGDTQVHTVVPSAWQAFIGNKPFGKDARAALMKQFPDKSASWYTGKGRENRKQFTMDYFNKKWPKLKLTDDNIGDACGIAYYAYYELTKRG